MWRLDRAPEPTLAQFHLLLPAKSEVNRRTGEWQAVPCPRPITTPLPPSENKLLCPALPRPAPLTQVLLIFVQDEFLSKGMLQPIVNILKRALEIEGSPKPGMACSGDIGPTEPVVTGFGTRRDTAVC